MFLSLLWTDKLMDLFSLLDSFATGSEKRCKYVILDRRCQLELFV